MIDQPRHLRVFLSSPGDVPEERALALQVIDRLPYDPLLRGKVTFEVVAWDKPGADTPMLATMTPQEAINQGLPQPSECDIVVVIFWARMGTPLPHPDYQKPDGSPYLSGTEWEYEDAMQAARQHKRPEVVIYRRNEKVLLDDEAADFQSRLEQKQRVRDFFAHFRDSKTGAIRVGINPYEKPENFREKFETHLKVLVKRLIETPIAAPPEIVAAPPTWTGSPFPGLRAFTPADEPIFFGRGRETDALVKRVSESRFVAVVGASGSGKSSLVGAGLIPRLKANAIEGSKDWFAVTFKPGEADGSPFEALAAGLLKTLPGAPIPLAELADQRHKLAEALRQKPSALAETCDYALKDSPAWAEVLLFIDQFEELFTVVAEEERRAFVEMLLPLTPGPSPTEGRGERTRRVRIVATLRADFYQRCVDVPALAELLQNGSYPLGVPGQVALYEMIVRPAERAGLVFESGLPERILEDTGNEPGALALMAYALDELYHARQDGKLTFAAYETLGGVAGAIGARAEHVFSGLDAEAQAALPGVFRDLIEVDERGTATRQRASLSQAAAAPAARRLVEAFTGARLLVQSQSEKGREPVVEVAHEALFRSWERLQQWIETAQADLFLLRQVRQAVEQWERQGRNDDFLWSGQRLKDAQAMVRRQQPRLSEAEAEFLRSEVERLEARLNNPVLDHAARARIGEQLHLIGDTRPGVGLREDGLPDIAWCYVEGGGVELKDDEKSFGKFKVQPFYMAKYPITFMQFQAFLDAADGFENDEWWAGLTEKYRKQEMAEQYFKFSNHPRESVSWYQAVAFTRWLTVKLPEDGYPTPGPSPNMERGERSAGGLMNRLFGKGQVPATQTSLTAAKWEIRLPTEWEWQQAATGGDPQKIYPWGVEWDGRRANTREAGLSRTTAVGMYPAGAAACGALDMSGNVFEWCLNDYSQPSIIGGYSNQADKLLRGGSFEYLQDLARAVSRFRQLRPGLLSTPYGLRLVVAPLIMRL